MDPSTGLGYDPYTILLTGGKLSEAYSAVTAVTSDRSVETVRCAPASDTRWTVPARRDATIPADAA